MRIIILEKTASTSDYLSRVAGLQTDNFSSIEELIQKDYVQGSVLVVVSQDTDAQKLQEACNAALFSIVLTDNSRLISSSKVYLLPTSTDYVTLASTLKTILDNLMMKRKRYIQPLPHADYDEQI